MRYYILAVVMIVLDQVTKWLVLRYMDLWQSIPVIEGFFYLTSHRNRGAAWGILQGQMTFFYIVTVLVIIAVIYYMQTYGRYRPLAGVALGLILGGAIGNFIDRLVHQEVVDFFDFVIPVINYNYPIFNIADASLVVGVICMIIQSFIEKPTERSASK
ncbi:lipoprotein signal peptidase [Bacillaceae bacterium SIJ1]|uniref:signal peptidase II n=1 Tax=Litoribacterium kuwaitense TaxID=1398745 RepID=UPI0013EBEC7F|nr:signal peptidase II [Litoribacterium kuwaitense]NGP44323.1 lipoprotein signal peptidase [Litoribacterium kuwaitense]